MTNSNDIHEKVRDGYSKIAKEGNYRRNSVSVSGCSCGKSLISTKGLAQKLGYSTIELESLSEEANLGLSCGNPNALAKLKTGEVLLDLGSGAGFDAFIASPKVGASGHVIGVDMTPEMLNKARKNIINYSKNTGLNNIEFRLGEIEHLPVADSSVDVIISNCVINLSPDKPQVWREMFRVLKPGGRIAVSDLALLKELPKQVMGMIESLIGCVAGAVIITESERLAKEVGFNSIILKTKPTYIEEMVNGKDPLYQKIMEYLPINSKPSDYITSLEITAQKPVVKSEEI